VIFAGDPGDTPVRTDSVATIESLGVTGVSYVGISAGDPGAPLLEAEDGIPEIEAGRSVLQVHPRGNPANPLRGIFATRAPLRPNLIGLTRVRILSVDGLTIEIDDIDAYEDTPVLDLKP